MKGRRYIYRRVIWDVHKMESVAFNTENGENIVKTFYNNDHIIFVIMRWVMD